MIMYSFTSFEKSILPEFRQKLSFSEDGHDVMNSFSYCVRNLLKKVFENEIQIKPEDIQFAPNGQMNFSLSERIEESDIFKNSDLKSIINRFAHSANDRFIHLGKKLKKTNLKTRH